MLVAGQEIRETVLSSLDGDSSVWSTPDIHYAILEVVGMARWCGIPRPFFSKYLRIDSRSNFYYSRMLRLRGLVVIQVSRLDH